MKEIRAAAYIAYGVVAVAFLYLLYGLYEKLVLMNEVAPGWLACASVIVVFLIVGLVLDGVSH